MSVLSGDSARVRRVLDPGRGRIDRGRIQDAPRLAPLAPHVQVREEIRDQIGTRPHKREPLAHGAAISHRRPSSSDGSHTLQRYEFVQPR